MQRHDVATFGQLFLDSTHRVGDDRPAVPAVNSGLVRRKGLGVMIYDFAGRKCGHGRHAPVQLSGSCPGTPRHMTSGNGRRLRLSTYSWTAWSAGRRARPAPLPSATDTVAVDVAPLIGTTRADGTTGGGRRHGISVTSLPSPEAIGGATGRHGPLVRYDNAPS
jgi:hypothetical protein